MVGNADSLLFLHLEDIALKNQVIIKKCFNKQKVEDTVSNLLSDCFFTINLKIICQIISIPVESDSAPLFANLFLYYHVSKWMNS